jgi:hypothetical protein
MSLNWIGRLVAGLLLSYGGSAANAAAACADADADAAALELRIVTTALASNSDRSLIVSVHDDGCVQLHRPAFRRDGGDYRLTLEPAALETLHRTTSQPALRNFDAAKVRADISAAQRKRDAGSERLERYSEPDADHYEIRWRDAGKRGTAAWTGLPGAAKAHPDNAALRAFGAAVQALQALDARSDAVRIDGVQP